MKIYTDGACKPNPGEGGWAFVILTDDGVIIHEDSGYDLNTTNNRMELTAIINGLKYSYDNNLDNITIYSDSTYCVNICNIYLNMWDLKTIEQKKNPDLLKELYDLIKKLNVKFIWIKGHNGNEFNDYVDMLCNKVINEKEYL